MLKVINVILDERIAGPSLRILSVAKKLKEKDIETVVIMPRGDQEFALELKSNNIRYHSLNNYRIRNTKNPFPNLLWIFFLPISAFRIARIIRRERADIIHCNGLVHIVGGLAGRIAGIKVFWHLNDLAVPKLLLGIFKPLVESLADHIVFASKAVESFFGTVRKGLSKGILYAPVDTSLFDPLSTIGAKEKIRKSFGIPMDIPVIGMVGNINYLKGVTDFVKAAGIISRSRPDVMFLHVGAKLSTKKHLYAEVVNEIDRLDLQQRFFLAGKQRNVREFLAAMDIFVIPSLSEACSMSLLEAMAMQKAIVATDVGGIPELVRDQEEALLVSPGKPQDIANKVTILLKNQNLREVLSRKARARAIENFDLSRCVEMHEFYYRSLVNRLIFTEKTK